MRAAPLAAVVSLCTLSGSVHLPAGPPSAPELFELKELRPNRTGANQSGQQSLAAGGSGQIKVAVLVAYGDEHTERPKWAPEYYSVHIYLPPKTCKVCHPLAQALPNSTMNAPMSWWCAQRFYMNALYKFVDTEPHADYYFLQHSNTMVFPVSFAAMLENLDAGMGAKEDLFMGHATEADPGMARYVQSGGGTLIRGCTMRRLRYDANMAFCSERAYQGEWCWHHMDWVLADCFRAVGVAARGHANFNQGRHCGDPKVVTCHPVPSLWEQIAMMQSTSAMQQQRAHEPGFFSPMWAYPCADASYDYSNFRESVCGHPGQRLVLNMSEAELDVALYGDLVGESMR